MGILCGFLGEAYGWAYGLALVVGLIAAATFLVYMTMRFHPSYRMPVPSLSTMITAVIIGALVLLIYGLLHYKDIFKVVTLLSVLASAAYMAKILHQCTPEERKEVWSAIGYILSFALFVALFEQSGSSFNFFLKNAVDREVLGTVIPASAINSFLNPMFVLLCGITLLPLFSRYMEKKKPVEGMIKVGCGFFFAAAGFFILAFGSIQETGALVPLTWIMGALFLKTLGELWIAPISLAQISRFAPPRFQSILVSFWTMAIAYGHYLAGIIAQFSVKPEDSPEGSIGHYANFFGTLGIMALVAGSLILLFRFILPHLLTKFRIRR